MGVVPAAVVPDDLPAVEPDSHWQALKWYALSRIVVASLLWLAAHAAFRREWLDLDGEPTFRALAFAYLLIALMCLALIKPLRPRLQLQLFLHVSIDLVFLTLLMHFSGGVRGGLGALMIASVAAGAVLSTRRLAATFAAGASLLLLIETAYSVAQSGASDVAQFGQAGVIGAACFLTAMSVNWLAVRLQAQEELTRRRGEDVRDQLAVTQRVIAELEQGVMVVSADGRVRTTNRAAQLMLGMPRSSGGAPRRLDQTLGAGWEELARRHAAWRADPRQQSDELELGPSPGAGSDAPGDSRLRVRFLSVRERDGADSVILVEDLRELEQRAQQLKLASMGRLSASIAHEIRNPLGAIRHANGLLAEQLDALPLQRLARIVEDNTVRIDRVIEDVLSISRRDHAHDEQVDMVAFLNEFLPEFVVQTGVDRKRLAIAVETSAPLRFDSNQLRQVLVNLVGNALRYASQKPAAVLIRWRELEDRRLELSIADDGPGLATDAMTHTFEPFFTTESRGTGLGLYLARELCNVNGAQIRYQRFRPENRYVGAFLIETRREETVPAP